MLGNALRNASEPYEGARTYRSYMYRIEFEPGDVGVFRTVEEIATAIRSGMITSKARIYHQATDKWLPIEFHPHYKKALELVAGGGAQASSSTALSSASPSSSHVSGPQPAARFTPAPHRVAIQLAAPDRPPRREPPPEPAAEPEPVRDHRSSPALEPEPPVESVAEPEPPVAREPVLRFVPLDPPTPRPSQAPRPSHAPRPAADDWEMPAPADEWERHDATKPELPAADAPAPPVVSTPERFAAYPPELPAADAPEMVPAAHAPAEAPDDFLRGPTPEPRPIVRPRLRMELGGRPRTPFLVALGGLGLLVSAYVGLSAGAAVPWPHHLNLGSLPRLPGRAAPVAAPAAGSRPAPAQAPVSRSALPATQPGEPVGTAAPPDHGPSFGGTSAVGGQVAPLARSQPAPAPAPDSIVGVAPNAAAIAVGAPLLPAAGAPAAGTPAAGGRLTPAVLVSRYQAAYAAARSELDVGLRTAGFANLFAPDRIGSVSGVRAARLSTGTASAYVARYRRREAEIEQAYADSASALGRELNWAARERQVWDKHKVLQESPEIAKLAGFLLQQIDSLYGVFQAQEGAYEVKNGVITFQDSAASQAYAALRPWLDPKVNAWADSASGPPTTAARVLRAMGSNKLPDGAAF